MSDSTVVAAVLGAGAVLRLIGLDHTSFWWDEVLTARNMAGGLQLLWRNLVGHEDNPPGYTLLTRAWVGLGRSDWMFRFPSYVAGLVLLVVMYRMAFVMLRSRGAAWVLSFAAVSPLLIHYSQEARAYAVFWALEAGSMLLFWEAQSQNRPRLWCLYFIVSLLSLYAHYLGFAGLAAQGLFLLVRGGWKALLRSPWTRWLAWQLLSFLPWFLVDVRSSAQHIGAEFARFGPSAGRSVKALLLALMDFAFGYSEGLLKEEWLFPLLPCALLAVVGFLLLGLRSLCFDSKALLLCYLLAPVVAGSGLALITNHRDPKCFGAAFVPFAVLIVAGARVPWRRFDKLRPLAIALLLALNVLALVNYHASPRYGRDDFKSAAQWISHNSSPNDPLLFVGGWNAYVYSYYDDRRPATQYCLWPGMVTEEKPVTQLLHWIGERHDRLWVVFNLDRVADPRGKLPRLLSAEYVARQRASFRGAEGVRVVGYVRRQRGETVISTPFTKQ